MTTLELKLTLPVQLAKQAKAAGLLKSEAIASMLREQLRKQAGEELRVMMDKLADANIPPMSENEIQAEINAVRKAPRARRA
jgi:post-segregation antitoxin (ccd killing protein)